MARYIVETCVETLQSAINSEQGGAQRIELNSALGLGGLTPTVCQLDQYRAKVSLPVICMVRPRPGDFCYSKDEYDLALAEASSLLAAGASGLAVGFLDSQGKIDSDRVSEFRDLCGDRELVFHRAFDCVCEPTQAIENLIDLGVDRILTSGGQETAIAGIVSIGNLQRDYGAKIELLPGSGVNSRNVVNLVGKTGCTQVHGTFRTAIETGSKYEPSIHFNQTIGLTSNQKYETSVNEVRQVVAALDSGQHTAN